MIEALDYDPKSGKLFWKITRGRARKGEEAGTLSNSGYICIGFKGVQFLAHRLAWFLHYGEPPKYHVDHINRVRTDNRIINLRDVSRSVNMLNTDAKGWEYDPRSGRYCARIMVEGMRKFIGSFACATAAHFAYKRYKQAHI